MKLEEMTPKNLKEAKDEEILQAWHRLNEWFSDAKKKNSSIEDYVNRGIWVSEEMINRGFKVSNTPLKEAIDDFKAKVRKETPDNIKKLFPHQVPEILLIKDFCVLGGSAAVTEKPEDFDVIIRAPYNAQNDTYSIDASLLHVALRRFLDPNKDGKLHFVPSPQGSFTDYIPLYDLIAKKREAVVERIEPYPAAYEGKDRVIKKSFEPFTPFIPPKPAMPLFTEFFLTDELWKWAENRLPIAVEPKFNGFRGIIEKKDDKTILWFEGKPELNQLKKRAFASVAQAINDIVDDFILDCDVALKRHGRRLPRNEMVKLNADEPELKKGETIEITCFDLPYWIEDLHQKPFFERREKLEEFFQKYLIGKAEKLFQISSVTWVNSRSELEKAAKWAFTSEPLSEGLVAKTKTSIYELDGSTTEWAKLKSVVELKVIVLDKEKTKGGQFVYRGGVLPSESLEVTNLTRLNRNTYVDLGKSFASNIDAKIGDILTVQIEELIPLETEIVWYAPRIVDIDDTRKTPYTLMQVVDLAKRGGAWQVAGMIRKIMLAAAFGIFKQRPTPESEMGETRGGLALRNWALNWYKVLPKKGGRKRFSYQHHWRGLSEDEAKYEEKELLKTDHSLHGDLRLEGEDALWGLTIFLGTTKENLKSDGDRLDDLPYNDSLQISWKLPQPVEWLEVGKKEPLIVPPRGIGGTTIKWSKFFKWDSGEYEVGYCEEHFFEIFLYGEKLRGRYTIQFAPVGEKKIWIIRRQEDETPFLERVNLRKQIEDQIAKNRNYVYISKPGIEPLLLDLKKIKLSEDGIKFDDKTLPYNAFRKSKIQIIEKNNEKRLVYGIVLEPDTIDAHGDTIESEEIEKAAHNYLMNSAVIGAEHDRIIDARVVESYIAPVDFNFFDTTIKKGTWLLTVKVFSDDEWEKVKQSDFTGFSIGALGVKIK